MSATKEANDLVRDIKATGEYDVVSNGAHYKVVNGEGKMLSVFPKTPSDSRWRENAVHQLIKCGVFKEDPRKNGGGQKKSGKSHLASPEIQALKVAAVKERARLLREQTNAIRDRITPLIAQAGGWGMGKGHVGASEVGRVAMHWGGLTNNPDTPKTEDGAKASAQANMKHPGGASEAGIRFWDAFVTAWESAEDQRRWYYDLVREMKGLPKTNVIVGGATLETTEPKKNLRRAGRVKRYMDEEKRHPLEPAPLVGHLALRAVMLMAAGAVTIDEDQIMDVGEKILTLEAEAASRENDDV